MSPAWVRARARATLLQAEQPVEVVDERLHLVRESGPAGAVRRPSWTARRSARSSPERCERALHEDRHRQRQHQARARPATARAAAEKVPTARGEGAPVHGRRRR